MTSAVSCVVNQESGFTDEVVMIFGDGEIVDRLLAQLWHRLRNTAPMNKRRGTS
jgi:hypothetical protein